MQNHRKGGKFNGNHTTFVEAALPIVDFAAKLDAVKNISAGIMKFEGKSSGIRNVKIVDVQGGLKLTVRQSISVQEVWIYTDNIHTTKLALSRKCVTKVWGCHSRKKVSSALTDRTKSVFFLLKS